MIGLRTLLITLGAFTLFQSLQAEPVSPLSPPLVTKTEWSARALTVADINGDGLNDVVLINNANARLEIFLNKGAGEPPDVVKSIRPDRWEPVLENAPFKKESMVTGHSMYDVIATDFNADGLCDLLYTSDSEFLSLKLQLSDGGFGKAQQFQDFKQVGHTNALSMQDIDSDGDKELCLLGVNELLIFETGAQAELNNPKRIALTSRVPDELTLIDINNDGQQDLIYIDNTSGRSLRVKLGLPNLLFGPEHLVELPETIASNIVINKHKPAPQLSYVQRRSGLLETITLVQEPLDSFANARPRLYPVAAPSDPIHVASGDFNADGLPDIVLNKGRMAQVLFFQGAKGDRFLEPVAYPGFSDVTKLLSVKLAGHPDAPSLLAYSEAERALGLSVWQEERLTFPNTLTGMSGEIVAFTANSFHPDKQFDDIAVLTKDDEGDHFLTLYTQQPDGHFQGLTNLKVEAIKRSPTDLIAHDFNHDGWLDILMLVPREPARLFLYGEKGIKEIATESSLRKTLFKDLSPNAIGAFDTDQDGYDELIIGMTGYARVVALNEQDELIVLDQFNARSHTVTMSAPFELTLHGETGLAYFDNTQKELHLLKRAEDGVLRFAESAEVSTLDIASAPVHLGGARFLFGGTGQMWLLDFEATRLFAESRTSYESDLPEINYDLLYLAQLHGSPAMELIAIDTSDGVFELLGQNDDDSWSPLMHFPIYEANRFTEGRRSGAKEPREITLADMDGDGQQDLLMLVHDRLLLYPRNPTEN